MSTQQQVDPAAKASLFILQDEVHEPMHDRFLWATMQRRDAEAAEVPEWEELRELASKIKEHTLTHLDRYLCHGCSRQNGSPDDGDRATE